MVDFTNLKDLYQNILPALNIKKNEFIKDGINYIYEDILNVDKEKIKIYVLNILTINKREAIF